MRYYLVAALALATFSAQAGEVWKITDSAGQVIYSTKPVPGATKIKLPEISIVRPLDADVEPRSKPAASPPRPSSKTASDVRSKILNDEIAVEESNLAKAKAELAEAAATRLGDERNYQKYLDRIQPLKDAVAQHEQNINDLRKELKMSR